MNRILLLLLVVITNPVWGQVDLNLGLRAYYPFSGNANDASGNSNNPVFNNATLTTDRLGNPNSAYHFNGTNNYMQIPNAASLNVTGGKFSLSVWVRVTGYYPGTCHGNSILLKGNDDTTPGMYHLWFDDNQFTNGLNCVNPVPDQTHQNFYGVGAYANPPGYTPYIQTNQWHHVVITNDGVTARLYVDCELKASKPQSQFVYSNADPLYFGKTNHPLYPYWLNADLDEVRIYDRTLTVDEVNVLGGCSPGLPCNNWLSTPSEPSLVRTGDLDISGDQLTIEVNFNRTAPVNPVGGYGFLISKHTGAGDVNYAMWPNGCAITTTGSGDHLISENCPIELNKTYHVAMVYDGTTLKFYRNGFLHSQTPASGNLVTNNLITTIGQNVPEGASTIFPFIGYINEVRIWNTARTQSQLQAYQYALLPSPTTQTGLVAYYSFNDLLNKQGNAAWNGTLGGNASINATNPNCTYVADSCAIICTIKNDFSFKRDPCEPLNVEYSTTATGYSGIKWDFGDGNTAFAGATLVHAYASSGNYPVTLITNYGSCADTVTKIIPVNIQTDNQLILTPDTLYCVLAPKKLRTQPVYGFCWSPATFLDDPNLPEPSTSTPATTTYYFNAETVGANTLLNGSFNSGNSGFVSDYIFANPSTANGQYFIGNNPQAWNASLSNCSDHSGGNGNMMMIRGANVADAKVWSQPITVTPNTNYIFSVWVQALNSPNPAQLQFAINNITIGSVMTTSLPTCTWKRVYTSWNSGSNTSITVSLLNKTVSAQANYFALDDIVFAPVTMKRDSVIITPVQPVLPSITISTPSTTICEGNTAIFTAVITNGGTNPGYQWLKNGNPVGTNSSSYTATGLINGDVIRCRLTSTVFCASPASIESNSITMNVEAPPANMRYSDLVALYNQSLQLQARNLGGNNYTWQPATGLSNPVVSNPVFSYSQTQEYKIFITTSIGCVVVDTQKVLINAKKGIYVPKAFSPNGDGNNDRLYPILVAIPQLYYFRVYNRWGILVFETNSGNPATGWDGKYKGELQPVETYTWVAQGIDIDGIIIKVSGATLLLR